MSYVQSDLWIVKQKLRVALRRTLMHINFTVLLLGTLRWNYTTNEIKSHYSKKQCTYVDNAKDGRVQFHLPIPHIKEPHNTRSDDIFGAFR